MVMSPEELAASAFTFMGLRTVPVAVTTLHDGRTNGLMALSGGPASVIPEAPRATVGITKYNFSHDLVLNGGVFVMHVLSNAPELVDSSIDIIRALAGSSGRDGDKLAGLRTRVGVTGAPILLDALSYVEARVTGAFDNDENTIFVGDVVAAEKLNPGGKLGVGEAWALLGKEWTDEYERNHEAQIEHCRQMRGLPSAGVAV
jgi:flavin reductase (DIM6/NTAB) family NADH-FMN oxidoreductase RutF